MNENMKFPFDEQLLQLKEHEEIIIWFNGKPFIIQPANENDIERINNGFFCID